MAQFDVYRTREGALVVDCQSDLLSSYNTRIVAPLLEPQDNLPVMTRLNPRLRVGEQEHVLMIEFLAAVPVSSLGASVTSLIQHEYAIKAALDMLISGF